MSIHLLAAPFTKVEESFNMQAVNDLLYAPSIEQFDHLEFSGVVPRTFLGPIVLAACARPFVSVFAALGWHKATIGVIARFVLGLGRSAMWRWNAYGVPSPTLASLADTADFLENHMMSSF